MHETILKSNSGILLEILGLSVRNHKKKLLDMATG